MCPRCTTKVPWDWSEAECFTTFVDSMCFRGKRIVSISPWSRNGGRISSWSVASR
jgi:hypothetical protein